MFDWLKAKDKKQDSTPSQVQQTPVSDATKSKQDLIREAMVHARQARETIGEETLNKVSEILKKQQMKMALEKAKEALKAQDATRLADNLKDLMRNNDKPTS
jgi:vacuolar-type H+-ATPase subunit H